MFSGKRVVVVMPAYNEEALIARAIDSVPRFVDHVVVVDDGSTDQTAACAQRASRDVEVVRHDHNLGAGAAVATGCLRSLGIDADLTAVMAADAQMDAADLPSLLAPVAGGQADYVKGDRLAWPDARITMPTERWLGNRVLSGLTRLALGVAIRDSQCGYVAMNQTALRALPLRELWSGYGYPNDWLSWAVAQDLRIHEVPVRPVYGNERSGIRLHHALGTIPWVIARAALRRASRSRSRA